MQRLNGKLMSGDREIATVRNGVITDCREDLLPLYLKRTKNIETWLVHRAIDTHRTNSRLLKRALRLRQDDDLQAVLAVHGATVTDRYWFLSDGENLTYDDVRFKENYFDSLALRGDPDGFSQKSTKTPELTNIGSFEKCWRLLDGKWWMYKSGNDLEYFSELFVCKLGEKSGLPMTHYELDGSYIRSLDFTDGGNVNFESMRSLTDDNEDYSDCYHAILNLSESLAEQYLLLIWTDTLCFNMDRHTENFGFLRDVKDGKILSLAPNFDNNIALISRGYPSDESRKGDGLIRFFRDFLRTCPDAKETYRKLSLPAVTAETIDACIDEIPIAINRSFVRSFILNGQKIIAEIIEN